MNARANVSTSVWERVLPWGMPVLLILGLLIRLPFLGDDGFKNDVQTFEAWAISLVEHGLNNFYGQTGFADYPPGYFYILALVGHVWELFRSHDPGYALLKALVKLPAVLADLGVGALLYAIGTRLARPVAGFIAAILYVLNPVTIFISAKWGQVDAIAGGLALLAVYFLLRSTDDAAEKPSWWIVWAWVVFAYSLLIKPQAAVLIPIFIAFAFTDRARMRGRINATLIGIGGAFLLALALTEPFHPTGNVIDAFHWLLQRYTFGSSVYAYNSVNAFNLWVLNPMGGKFWNPDSQFVGVTLFGHQFGLAQSLWGVILVVAALGLIIWRYLQERTETALLESCALALIGFFVLATRMHERYIFDGLLFTIACVPFARRYLWGMLALSIVLFANLDYSLQYLVVMSAPQSAPGVDAQNLWGMWTHLFALGSVATFFALGYAFLGGTPTETMEQPSTAPTSAGTAEATDWAKPNNWFDPREGLTAMRAPLDYIVMALLGIGNFVLSFVNYWYPSDKIFDEIYFARAAEEYLQNLRIYENTHPPLSKLLVTLSVMLFGGMPAGHGVGGWTGLNAIIGHMANGDNAFGWRFLDVVAGAVVVMLLYVFAKRVTGSTIFAAVAALLLSFDGMHFVQSRIATPESFVVCFSLFAVYAFYRFWIASQVEERVHVNVPAAGYALAIGGSLLAGVIISIVWGLFNHEATPPDTMNLWGYLAHVHTITMIVIAGYVTLGAYLLMRYVVLVRMYGDGKRESTFAEGSYALSDGVATTVYACDGGVLTARGGSKPQIRRGALSQARGGNLVYEGSDVTITYAPDESVTYESPSGSATYAQDEIRADGTVERGKGATLWLLLFTIALGLLVGSKWYGVMGFGVSFVALIGIWLQRFFFERRPALWGNPRGFRIDGALVTIGFIAATVYGLIWVPDLLRHSPDPNEVHNISEVVHRQYDMYEYHHNLNATHPYSSKWWEWPIDYVPIAYYYQDRRPNQQDDKGCCVYEITSLPNPFILWFGLLCVPLVGFLAWRERNKAYALIVLAYLSQWLPWAQSPRIAFAYHFYVDIPLICLCNAIILQRLWQWGSRLGPQGKWMGGAAVGAYVALVGLAFVYFYPILSATGISHADWNQRMWTPTWVVGPG